MNSMIQSRFFMRLLGGLSLMTMFLLLPHNAKATSIVSFNAILPTGQCGAFDCTDPFYAVVGGSVGEPLKKTNLSGTAPGFLAAPAGPSGAFWIAMLGDVQFGAPVNDWRVTFSAPPGTGNITVTGTMAAEGPVAVALNGFGNFAGPQSLTQLGNFSVTVAAGTTNTLDFIFTGCISYPACTGSNDPVYGLLVDPNWSPALPGTPLDTIPESVLFADGGAAPVISSTPEPASFFLMGSGLLAMGGILRRRIFGR
jgi:PEP-CTERM motif